MVAKKTSFIFPFPGNKNSNFQAGEIMPFFPKEKFKGLVVCLKLLRKKTLEKKFAQKKEKNFLKIGKFGGWSEKRKRPFLSQLNKAFLAAVHKWVPPFKKFPNREKIPLSWSAKRAIMLCNLAPQMEESGKKNIKNFSFWKLRSKGERASSP